ncbi:Speckle-type POZ protein B-like protein [Aphelenchoides besseyi]|nr:Speckle-type POZ protein B-like protein [Aphelenchoides besseyi]
MQRLSAFADPKIATWRLEDYSRRYRQAIENDRWASEPFAFEDPKFGSIEFYFQFIPKIAINPNPSDLCMQITNGPSVFATSMECNAWIETLDNKRSQQKSETFIFETNKTFKEWSPFLSFEEMSEFSHSSTVFICCRFPYPVKSIGLISKNNTLYRWPLTDFWMQFALTQYQTVWKSDRFTIPEFQDVEFSIRLYPLGDKEEKKGSCGVYLYAENHVEYSKILIHCDLWIENSKSRHRKLSFNHDFSSPIGYGYASYMSGFQFFGLSRHGNLNVCFNLRPILDLYPQPHCASSHNELGLLFNNSFFSDAEIHVDGKVFKVSRLLISGSSPIFRAMFDRETEEQKSGVITIKDVNANIVEAMLFYIYTNEVKDLKEIAAQLLPIADSYQVNPLVKKCTDSIVVNLSVKNVLPILELAFEHSHLKGFRHRVFKFVQRNYVEICKLDECEEFMLQHPEIAIELLQFFAREFGPTNASSVTS